MAILSGHALKYSLAEILHSVHQQNRTGLISIFADPNSAMSIETHYLWVRDGHFVGVANKLDGMGLLADISRRKILSSAQIREVINEMSMLRQPLGLHLKCIGLIDVGQLRLLFNAQTSRVFKLSEIGDRLFNFDPSILPCNAEMTGLCMSAQEIMCIVDLPILPEWDSLAEALIDLNITSPELPPTPSKSTPVSTSFLGNLMGFLKRKSR
jgi:hypothetical protein